jgi:hypothetical protein
MPGKSRSRFVDCVCSNEHVKAIESFHHDDATMQENLNPPRGPRGIDEPSARCGR